jgi:thioredoxin reductase
MKMTDIAIVGAGPAGLSAALEATRVGAKVVLIDENLKPGGQLFKQIHKFFGSREHKAGIRGVQIAEDLLAEGQKCGVEVLLDTAIYGIFKDNILGLAHKGRTMLLKAKKIILCTGAIENPVFFPGWTLPGVMTAGAVQTLVNIYRVLPDTRFLMIGSGNVGLIISYQLLQAGAKVEAIVEAAPQIGGYQVHAAKVLRAGVPIYTKHTVKEVLGDGKVETAIITEVDSKWQPIKGTEKRLDVGAVCLAVGLSPQIDLARLCNCETEYVRDLGGFVPLHDQNMETTARGIYVAGDIAGVEEASVAIEEGRLAGVAAAETLGFIDVCSAEECKIAIWARLNVLRSGAFGDKRQNAKMDILRKIQRCRSETEQETDVAPVVI